MTIKMTNKGNAKNTKTGEKYKAVRESGCVGCVFTGRPSECKAAVCGPNSRADYPEYKVQGSVIFVRKEKAGA